MATLMDIANLVGVSVPTVSKVLSNKSQKCASPETQNRIWQAVHDLGYTPNAHAKKLASNVNEQSTKNVIAIYMCEEKRPFFFNYYQMMRRKLELEVLSFHYIPYMCSLDMVLKKESPVPGKQMVGLVIIGSPSPETISSLTKAVPNAVVLSLERGMLSCDKVFCNFTYAVRSTISAAFKGAEPAVCFVGPQDSPAARICMDYKKGEEPLIHMINSACTVSDGFVAGLLIGKQTGKELRILCEGREIAVGVQKAFGVQKIPAKGVTFLILDDGNADSKECVYDSVFVDLAHVECVNMALWLLEDRIRRQHKLHVAYEVSSLRIGKNTEDWG